MRAHPPRGYWWRWQAGQREWRRSWGWEKLRGGGGPCFVYHCWREKAEPQGQSEQNQRRQDQAVRFHKAFYACFGTAARVAVHDSKDHAGQSEKCQQKAPEEHRGGGPMAGLKRGPHHFQLAEKRTERRAGSDREHAGDKNRRGTWSEYA